VSSSVVGIERALGVAGFVWGRPWRFLLAFPVFLLVFLVRFR
jgi:hypothetical protein